MLCYSTLFGWVALELVSDFAGLSTKILFSLHCTASRRFHSICFPHTTLQGLRHFWSSHLSTSLDPKTSTVGSARTWSRTITVRIGEQNEIFINLDFPHFKRSHLKPPKPSDGKLCVKIANDWKVAHVTQVDEVVLTEEFAKGREGLC